MEILAPAGSYEAVEAAVRNGANAVYLGQQKFNARQNAENFDEEMLQKAVNFCHQHQVKVYQTLNTLVFDEEMDALQDTIETACCVGIDAVIVQDFGVLNILRKVCPQLPVHGSTQMSVHTVKGAQLMKELGLKRIVLAREMTLEEIQSIIQQVKIEVEVFVHGALCMCVSGQCYMSAAIGGRSGNRGSCAGTCRLPFRAVNGQGAGYDLSLKDLCAANQYWQLEEIGVTSLKIEGRMKRPEYVAAAAQAYHQLEIGKKPNFDQLRAVFSRSGFTDGYLTGKIDGNMFGFRSKEDVVSATPEVLSQLRESYHKEMPIFPLKIKFRLKGGQASQLELSDAQGHTVQAEGAIPEPALRKPTTAEMAEESLRKLGGTPYYVDSFTAEVEDGLMLPKSKLNELRRSALELLEQERLIVGKREFHRLDFPILRKRSVRKSKLRGRFANTEQLPQGWQNTLEAIYLPVDAVWKQADLLLPDSGKIILEPDRVLFSFEEKQIQRLKQLKNMGFSRLAASNPAHIQIGRELGFEISGMHFLNITNTQSANVYQHLGASELILSAELTVGRLNSISPESPQLRLGAVVYGYLPLMVVRNCPMKRYYSCQECRGSHSLIDRLGSEFRVVCNQSRYSEVLNSTVLQLADRMSEFSSVDFGVLYFTVETAQQCERIIQEYQTGVAPEGKYTRGLYYRGVN